MTHCDVIAALSDQFPIKVSLERRFTRFIKKGLSSSNSIVNVISHITICNPGAPNSAKFRGGCRGPSKIRQRGGCNNFFTH